MELQGLFIQTSEFFLANFCLQRSSDKKLGGGRNLMVPVLSLFCLGAQSGVKCGNNIQVSTLGRLMRAVNN